MPGAKEWALNYLNASNEARITPSKTARQKRTNLENRQQSVPSVSVFCEMEQQ